MEDDKSCTGVKRYIRDRIEGGKKIIFDFITPPSQSERLQRQAYESFAPSKDIQVPVVKSKDEEFLLPSTLRPPFIGVFAGSNGDAKTKFIQDLIQRNKNLPINYGQVPQYGSCQQKMRFLLCEVFKFKPEYPINEYKERQVSDDLLRSARRAAEDYRQNNTLQPVAILDKFENMDGCEFEVGLILRAAKQAAEDHSMSFILVPNTKRAEEMILRNCDKTRHETHVFGATAKPTVAEYP